MSQKADVVCFEPVIHAINLEVGSTPEQDRLFAAAVAKLKSCIRIDRASIALFDANQRAFALHLLESHGTSSDLGAGMVLPYEEGDTLRLAFDSGEPVIHYYTDENVPVSGIAKSLHDEGYRACVSVPLRVRGRVVGTFNVAAKASVRYSEQEIRLLSVVAGLLAMAIDNARAHQEIERLENSLGEHRPSPDQTKALSAVDRLIGTSTPFIDSVRDATAVAPTDLPTLITGETGTGKEMIARAIHAQSKRSNRRLITVNCAALPRELVESELFGHEAGAFTGAIARKRGQFELADGGTIFLDEIGDLPMETQPKLLRVLQESQLQRIGGEKIVEIDVRVIAATNRDLSTALADGEFREDLYYRINVFPIHCPPLRERREDIPLLVHHFLAKHCKTIGTTVKEVSKRRMKQLVDSDWPGNVRELENVIQRAVVLSEGRELEIHEATSREAHTRKDVGHSLESLDELEHRHILTVLQTTNWVISGPKGAAKILGMHPNTLRSRMGRLGIETSAHAIS